MFVDVLAANAAKNYVYFNLGYFPHLTSKRRKVFIDILATKNRGQSRLGHHFFPYLHVGRVRLGLFRLGWVGLGYVRLG